MAVHMKKGSDIMEDTFEKVSNMIRERFEITDIKILPDTTFDELGKDSIDLFDFVSDLEEEFGISIPDEEFEKLKTIEDIVELVEKYS